MIKNRGLVNHLSSVSKKSGISEEALQRLMSDGGALSIDEATSLAKFFKKGWATFLIDSPEQSQDNISEYRTLGNQEAKMTPGLFTTLQEAEYILRLSLEILPDHKVDIPVVQSRTTSNPITLANYCRDEFVQPDKKFKNMTEALRYYKDILESWGIYVAEKPLYIEEDKTRAFTLELQNRYIVVISNQDALAARIFSLAHELGHILIGQIGLCDISPESRIQTEVFCNNFATHFLVSNQTLRDLAQEFSDATDDPIALVGNISNSLKLSHHLIAIRLKNLGYISDEDVESVIEKQKEEFEKRTKNSKGFPENYYRNTINYSGGMLFNDSILQALDNGAITSREASRILSIDENKITTLREKIQEFKY